MFTSTDEASHRRYMRPNLPEWHNCWINTHPVTCRVFHIGSSFWGEVSDGVSFLSPLLSIFDKSLEQLNKREFVLLQTSPYIVQGRECTAMNIVYSCSPAAAVFDGTRLLFIRTSCDFILHYSAESFLWRTLQLKDKISKVCILYITVQQEHQLSN